MTCFLRKKAGLTPNGKKFWKSPCRSCTRSRTVSYTHLFLLDSELADLQSTYPGQYEDYINRLSAYMASSGKHYANHYATIRK